MSYFSVGVIVMFFGRSIALPENNSTRTITERLKRGESLGQREERKKTKLKPTTHIYFQYDDALRRRLGLGPMIVSPFDSLKKFSVAATFPIQHFFSIFD